MAWSIGSESFFYVEGQITRPQEFVEVLTRPNLSGVTLRKGGVFAWPSELITMIDAGTAAAAHNKVSDYRALIDAGPQNFVRDGLAFQSGITNPIQLHVLHVEEISVRPKLCIVGGLNVATGGAGWVATCRWWIQPVAVSP